MISREVASLIKIKDRIILGVVSGLLANQIKEFSSLALRKFGLGDMDGPKKAAGMFLPKYKMLFYDRNTKAKIIGHAVDSTIGSMLGMCMVFVLTNTGKKHYVLKGMSLGHVGWVSLYGFLSRHATSVYPISEDNNLNGLINHTVFGMVAAALAVKLGDESLFIENYFNQTAREQGSNSQHPQKLENRLESQSVSLNNAPGVITFGNKGGQQ